MRDLPLGFTAAISFTNDPTKCSLLSGAENDSRLYVNPCAKALRQKPNIYLHKIAFTMHFKLYHVNASDILSLSTSI